MESALLTRSARLIIIPLVGLWPEPGAPSCGILGMISIDVDFEAFTGKLVLKARCHHGSSQE
jgi:hypothetical protein